MLAITFLKLEIINEGKLALLKAARDNSKNNDNAVLQTQK